MALSSWLKARGFLFVQIFGQFLASGLYLQVVPRGARYVLKATCFIDKTMQP